MSTFCSKVVMLIAILGGAVKAHGVQVTYTIDPNTNLDGHVDITDLGNLATHWQTPSMWTGGDFDYSGFIDITDLGMLATNWQAGVGNPLGWLFNDALASFGLPDVRVPDPARGVLLVVASLLAFRPGALLRRDISFRRRRID